MDSFDSGLFAFDPEAENAEDEQNNFFNGGSFRDSTLFLVDCSPNMFVKLEDEDTNLFQKCMKAIQNMYQHKIYGSDRDFLGIVFFGTEKNNTEADFQHIYTLQDLDQPSAERIKQIEKLSTNFNQKDFDSTYGHSDNFKLHNVLWWCSTRFSQLTQKLDTKRIILFTRTDNPHEKDKNQQKLAKNKAKDLSDIGIALDVIPVILKGESFDHSKFYGDLLMLSDEQIKQLPDPAENFDELEKSVRSKDHKRRPYAHLNLNLSNDLAISCSLFNLVRECPKPSKIKLDKKTNVETKSVTRRYNADTGEILLNSDTKLAIDVFDKRVTFEQDEIKSIKKFGNTGLKLLGFKSINKIKPYMYIKPGHFLYPDEKQIEGSTTLFECLLDKCIKRKRFILAEMIPRVNTPTRMVALIPQEEELDENKIQIMAPGFHVIYLPFADDFREIDRKITAEKNEEHVELFSKIVGKLKFQFRPENFQNPSLQKLWSEIEAIALARDVSEEVVDLTIPDTAKIEKRAGQYLDEFAKHYNLQEFAKSKRKNNDESTAGPSKKAKQNEELDVEAEAKAGKLDKLTLPILKEFMKNKGISATGVTKKDDIIRLIKRHLKI